MTNHLIPLIWGILLIIIGSANIIWWVGGEQMSEPDGETKSSVPNENEVSDSSLGSTKPTHGRLTETDGHGEVANLQSELNSAVKSINDESIDSAVKFRMIIDSIESSMEDVEDAESNQDFIDAMIDLKHKAKAGFIQSRLRELHARAVSAEDVFYEGNYLEAGSEFTAIIAELDELEMENIESTRPVTDLDMHHDSSGNAEIESLSEAINGLKARCKEFSSIARYHRRS